jgi:hypothetical protein
MSLLPDTEPILLGPGPSLSAPRLIVLRLGALENAFAKQGRRKILA